MTAPCHLGCTPAPPGRAVTAAAPCLQVLRLAVLQPQSVGATRPLQLLSRPPLRLALPPLPPLPRHALIPPSLAGPL